MKIDIIIIFFFEIHIRGVKTLLYKLNYKMIYIVYGRDWYSHLDRKLSTVGGTWQQFSRIKNYGTWTFVFLIIFIYRY